MTETKTKKDRHRDGYWKEYYAKHKEDLARKRKEKYATDEAYRENIKAAKLRSVLKHYELDISGEVTKKTEKKDS